MFLKDVFLAAFSGIIDLHHNPLFLTHTMDSTVFAGKFGIKGNQDGPPSVSLLNRPVGLSFDNDGNLFVIDADNFAIRKINKDGSVLTIINIADIVFSHTTKILAHDGSIYLAHPMGIHKIHERTDKGHTITLISEIDYSSHICPLSERHSHYLVVGREHHVLEIDNNANHSYFGTELNFLEDVAVNHAGIVFVSVSSFQTIICMWSSEFKKWIQVIGKSVNLRTFSFNGNDDIVTISTEHPPGGHSAYLLWFRRIEGSDFQSYVHTRTINISFQCLLPDDLVINNTGLYVCDNATHTIVRFYFIKVWSSGKIYRVISN